SFINGVTKVLPYPAAIVDGRIITYHDWRYEVEAVTRFSQKKFGEAKPQAIEKEVLDKLIYQTIFKKIARKYKIEALDVDVEKSLEQIESQMGGKEETEKAVADFFGWDMATFQERIVRPETLKQKLYDGLGQSENFLKQTEERAQQVLKEVKAGDKSFNELATEYSEDPGSAENGGDLDWFPKGVMVKEFEDAAFALNPGEVSDLIKTDYGYHIIKLKDRRQSEEGEDEINASHILIRFTDFEEYLKEYENKAKIYKFVALD
ncbi:peptidylprolyl isomerase, partial [Patescibacteria group bacterium]|nr:peptidylprolyl isomerase [Patescibacteria group bacterium]